MTFAEFLPEYLDAHLDRRTQIVHAVGTSAAVALAGCAAMRRKPRWLLAALAAGYLPAWISHWIFERNVPKTFSYPVHSLRGDFVMAYKLVRGELRSEPKGS
ncbi:MAG: DUF962 domain-containing protein [Candidatus Eremiobacteraeota bacterium]|nr:DUF962 domain-containing protein [Candidatus Eremiobacteraeota bacterium]